MEESKEDDASSRWQRVPRELRLAIRRVHVNLGHARLETCCALCASAEPARQPSGHAACSVVQNVQGWQNQSFHRSKLPTVDEFGVIVGMDVIEVKDSDQVSWSLLNILDLGTTYRVVVLLAHAVRNPHQQKFIQGWSTCAGLPERGVVLDQAGYFMTEFARNLEEQGCEVSLAANGSPWRIAAVERHGGTWKTIWRKLAWSQQIAGKSEVLQAVAEVNKAGNGLARRAGFSPEQWVSWEIHTSPW